ncbi:hypothetical protein [Actinomadura macrotermitis]|nr:hypothetical protein [Actinomadura macrotermitis]
MRICGYLCDSHVRGMADIHFTWVGAEGRLEKNGLRPLGDDVRAR